jgi:AcrR family transcriptional regulator
MAKQSVKKQPISLAEPAPAEPARSSSERIVDVARELFCRDGIHATGIDRILAGANASKMTLYTRFGSKEALVREVLTREGAAWREAFFAAITGPGGEPAEQLRRVVPALANWFHGGRFYGCAFMNAAAEHAKGEPTLRALAAEHHQQILAFLRRLATAADLENPPLLARQILLTMDGAIAALMVSGDPAVLTVAQQTLDAILTAARR